MRTRSLRFVLAAAVVVTAAGCASVTREELNASLAQARQAYADAQANPNVPRYAPQELAQAGLALNRAEQLAASDADSAQTVHQAYMAQQNANIARYVASARASEAELGRAEGDRQRAVLAARAKEADAGRARAEQKLAQAGSQTDQDRQAMQAELARLQSEVKQLRAGETERGVVLTLGSELLFDTGQATLKPGALRALDKVARFLNANPDREVVVEGFTDNTGTQEINERLSQRRAEVVKEALVARGVPTARVIARGQGESYPVASNNTAAGRQMNRRVEIFLPREGAASVGASRAAGAAREERGIRERVEPVPQR